MARTTLLTFLATLILTACSHSRSGGVEFWFEPEEPLASQLYSAIWSDIQSNAWIGNGNALLAAWSNAGPRQGAFRPALHIEELLCNGSEPRLRCEFGLFRDGGAKVYLGSPAPDKLACTADFVRSEGNGLWSIPRLPPGPNGGHTRITIECKPVN